MNLFCRTDDPARDYLLFDSEREEALDKHPLCCECKERIQDDNFFVFKFHIKGSLVPTFRIICPSCLDKNHKVNLDEYLEEKGVV